jgi:hypothetical protein
MEEADSIVTQWLSASEDRSKEPEGRRWPLLSRWLIAIGLLLVVVGLLWPWLSKLGLGRLPGDIAIERGNFTFYFLIVTCLIVSIVLSLVFWLMNR